MKLAVAGSTGLVGQLCVDRLAKCPDVESIVVVGRRLIKHKSDKVVSYQADIGDWPQLVAALDVDAAISTLGSTLRDAGSEERFFEIDHDANIAFARAARAAGASSFKLVSSIGAHAGSRNFYLATKGKTENCVQQIGFDRVDFFRPGLLRGPRQGRARPIERIGVLMSPVTDFLTPKSLDHYRSIEADTVANAIVASFSENATGAYFHSNRAMHALAAHA